MEKTKLELISSAYTEKFGKLHILIKLAEEASELAQAALKLADKDLLKNPISSETLEALWEEMAHLLVFWDMVGRALGNSRVITENYRERVGRIYKKLGDKNPASPYPARLFLAHPQPTPTIALPYGKVNNIVVVYLTQEELDKQIVDLNSQWYDPHTGIEATFDFNYWRGLCPNLFQD